MRILIVDDDARFSRFLQLALEEGEGVQCVCARSGDAALAALDEAVPGHFELVLLDVEMPGMSGWDLLYELRVAGNEIPVIFVSGNKQLADKVKGLNMGADDYVVKPFKSEELVARMKAVLRRRESLGLLVCGDLTIDLARRHVQRDAEDVELTPREFDLMYALVRAKGALVRREDLLAGVWGFGFDPGTNVLDVHIGRLRKKLDKHGPPLIVNVRGEGYRLEAQTADHHT